MKIPRVLAGSLLLAALTALTTLSGGSAAQAAAPAIPTEPVYYLRGSNPAGCTLDSTSEAAGSPIIAKLRTLTSSPVTVVPVTYSTCDNDADTAEHVYDQAALQFAQAITANTPVPAGTTATKVDVITNSLGGLVARRCAVLASLGRTGYAPCTRIDDLVQLVPPNHGSDLAVRPPTDLATCSWVACNQLTDGVHFASSNGCSLTGFFNAQNSKACKALSPGSDSITSISKAPYGTVPDETPGSTSYTTLYSYGDEIVFFRGQSTTSAAHPSNLDGAANYALPKQTHSSILGTSTIVKRAVISIANPSRTSVSTDNGFSCGTYVADFAARVLLDTATPVIGTNRPTCTQAIG